MNDPSNILSAALACLDAGLCVLPARLDQKRPVVPSWKQYQQRRPTEVEVRAWFSNNGQAMCILTGAVTGNAETLDFDAGGALFDRWAQMVEEQAPGLLARLVIEKTQHDGRHVAYRSEQPVCGNMKLAQRPGLDGRAQTLIETRGEGGLFLCAPSPGYEIIQGSLTDLPVLSADERDMLLSAAWALNECLPAPQPIPGGCSNVARPGDDFAERGDVRAVLVKHGWTRARTGENEYWRRPGKTAGWSATLKDRVFYVFSSNAAPFEPNRAYAPFGVYALLEHNGDYAAAAGALRALGYGQDVVGPVVDISSIVAQADGDGAVMPAQLEDPGPMPSDLLEVPGFIRMVVDFTLATAPYPQPVLAFAAALTLQGFLAGRKVRDAADTRTNLYVLALANSGSGKDHPRKVNQRILVEAGMQDCLGDTFASGEGIEDRMLVTPALLFQTDEIDGLMNSINRAADARHESIMNVLLKMYTSSNAIYPLRVKAGKQAPGVIHQPSLCMLGTAVPKYYYEALSVRMLNNGFFARLIILESGQRGRGQTPVLQPISPAILDIARWWARYSPGHPAGNLLMWNPQPTIVEAASAAEAALDECRAFADDRYTQAEEDDDQAAMAIWARAYEKARKLALLHAVSECHHSPSITERAVRWAWRFVEYQTRRMLYMAGQHVAQGEFDAKCKRMLEVLAKWRSRKGDQWMAHWDLARRLGWSDKEIEEVRSSLVSQRRIGFENGTTKVGGKPGQRYRLCLPQQNVVTPPESQPVATEPQGCPMPECGNPVES